MKTTMIGEREFDEWVALAKDDPDAFERLRRAAIEECIREAPDGHRERLRRLQWRIDQERRLARTPMAACVRISRMMWDSVLGEGGLRDHLEGLAECLRGRHSQISRACLLPFERHAAGGHRNLRGAR